LPARKATFLAGVPRTLGYKVLGELETLGLVVKKDEPGKVAVFSAAHPLKLKELAENRLNEAKDAKNALESTLSKLISDFNTVAGQPGVRILEGLGGIAELYEDELNEQQLIRLIRSPEDDSVPELKAMVQKQIEEQKKLGISVRVIAPMTPGTPQKIISFDKERGVERRIIPLEQFAIPAQIAIYANKVALTAYEGSIITTIIENTAIRLTFEIMFEYIWRMAEPEHERILQTFKI
jgi:sugar-specific transcriptional regulator TrmB